MEKNIEIIVEITEQLRSSKQGRYLQNIADLCKTKHGWDLTTTKAAIDEATKQQRTYTSVMNGKISYQKRKEKISTDEAEFRDTDVQTDPITELPCRKDDDDFERLAVDLQDFKEHTFFLRFQNVGVHHPVYQKDRKDCALCKENVKKTRGGKIGRIDRRAAGVHVSYVRCEMCNVHLCLNKDRNCFKSWHTKV